MTVKLYAITIQPTSGFGTPLKGDTIFGHFCWQVAYDASLLNGGLEEWIACYGEKPFAVFSSAWPTIGKEKPGYALKRPDLPISYLFKDAVYADKRALISNRKELKKRKWMMVGGDLSLKLQDTARYVTDKDLVATFSKEMDAKSRQRIREMPHPRLISNHEQPHNTINRLTSTTGEGMFAPYSESCSLYLPDMKLVIFALLDSDATDVNRVVTAFERIGRWGYGKDASTGHGRFLVDAYKELTIPLADSPNACYTLGPTVPEKGTYSSCFFAPFVRFGKHGDVLVRSGNPFKNPVIMADEGAIFMTENEEVFRKPFIGRAVRDVSKANPKSVCQGYSIYLPFRMEM